MVAHGEGVERVIDLELELEPRSTDVDKATYACIWCTNFMKIQKIVSRSAARKSATAICWT